MHTHSTNKMMVQIISQMTYKLNDVHTSLLTDKITEKQTKYNKEKND